MITQSKLIKRGPSRYFFALLPMSQTRLDPRPTSTIILEISKNNCIGQGPTRTCYNFARWGKELVKKRKEKGKDGKNLKKKTPKEDNNKKGRSQTGNQAESKRGRKKLFSEESEKDQRK